QIRRECEVTCSFGAWPSLHRSRRSSVEGFPNPHCCCFGLAQTAIELRMAPSKLSTCARLLDAIHDVVPAAGRVRQRLLKYIEQAGTDLQNQPQEDIHTQQQ